MPEIPRAPLFASWALRAATMLETLGGGVVEVGGADLATTVERANVRVVVEERHHVVEHFIAAGDDRVVVVMMKIVMMKIFWYVQAELLLQFFRDGS